ncbi:6521_t:CDS:2 [Entrophospora sp. SA101]|nr:5444_t:CDS:2 [Entrophospora sp. SA101]CAJ0766607.1 6521_t:CDS:2 [Entrophospora sp. SA101]CAJ0851456.1 19256_t:CDS:2 [Entrophospora sp. SA101]
MKLLKQSKEKLRVLNLEPWNFRNSSTTIMTPSSPIQNCLKEEILKGSFEELDQDNPLCSNILDVSDPDSWLKPFFNDDEWNELSDIKEYDINEGTWMSHSVTIPFNIAARDIQKLRLLVQMNFLALDHFIVINLFLLKKKIYPVLKRDQ